MTDRVTTLPVPQRREHKPHLCRLSPRNVAELGLDGLPPLWACVYHDSAAIGLGPHEAYQTWRAMVRTS